MKTLSMMASIFVDTFKMQLYFVGLPVTLLITAINVSYFYLLYAVIVGIVTVLQFIGILIVTQIFLYTLGQKLMKNTDKFFNKK